MLPVDGCQNCGADERLVLIGDNKICPECRHYFFSECEDCYTEIEHEYDEKVRFCESCLNEIIKTHGR